MNKIIPILAFSILLLVPIGAQNAFAGPAIISEEYECYDTLWVASGILPATVSLLDQFGSMEGVTIEEPTKFCASSNKIYQGITFQSPHDFENHLNCYSISGNSAPIDPNTGQPYVVDLEDQFGTMKDVEIGPPIELCDPARKRIVDAITGQIFSTHGPVNDTIYKCYAIEGAPLDIPITMIDQFNTYDHTVLNPDILCNPVTKVLAPTLPPGTDPPSADASHLKCYTATPVAAIIDPDINIEATDQFGEIVLQRQEANRVCTEVTKTIVNNGNGITIGGEIIPIESASLILAGAQSTSWMIPVLLSAIGIGIFVVSKKSENS